MATIERHVLGLNQRLVRGAEAIGVETLSDLESSHRSGIVLLGLGSRRIDALDAKALDRRVGITIRDSGVRVSPHGYNMPSDIDAVLRILEEST